jgi:hypothetical protein
MVLWTAFAGFMSSRLSLKQLENIRGICDLQDHAKGKTLVQNHNSTDDHLSQNLSSFLWLHGSRLDPVFRSYSSLLSM